jgi:putative endonuclease
MDRQQQGAAAEQRAREFLVRRGLTPVCANYRCRGGELDLVMLEGGTLVIIEVRQRSSDHFGAAYETVDRHKRQRIVYAAEHLLMTRPALRRHPARFDVITVSGAAGAGELSWIRNAFLAER